MNTIIRVESQRQTKNKREFSTRYYISDLKETAFQFYQRIRGYWGVENRVHYVRDVTQGEDKSRIRTKPLPQIMAIARNLALIDVREFEKAHLIFLFAKKSYQL